MVHVHGAQAQQLAEPTRGVDPAELVAAPVEVGKHTVMALVCDFTGELLARPFEFPMTIAGVRLLVERVQAAGGPTPLIQLPGAGVSPSVPAPGKVVGYGRSHGSPKVAQLGRLWPWWLATQHRARQEAGLM